MSLQPRTRLFCFFYGESTKIPYTTSNLPIPAVSFFNECLALLQIYPAVVRALKNKTARHALTEDLKSHAAQNKCMLDHQQFLMVVKLFNALLQNESPLDENGIAAHILPLGDTFYRVSQAKSDGYAMVQKRCRYVSQISETLSNFGLEDSLVYFGQLFFNNASKSIRSRLLTF